MPKNKDKDTVAKTEKKNVDVSEKKKKKKKKDPHKPKVPQSAFLFFSTEKRKEVIAAHPGISFQDIAKTLGEMWKNFTDADKKTYEQSAQRDRLRYKEQMEHYKPPVQQDSSDDDKKTKKRKRKRRDPNEPKGAPSAYILYANSIRDSIKKENPQAQFTDTGRIIGVKWKALSEDEKKPFIEQANILRVIALKQKEEYKRTHPDAYDKDGAPSAKRAKKEKSATTTTTTTTSSVSSTPIKVERLKLSDESESDKEDTDEVKPKVEEADDDDDDDDDDEGENKDSGNKDDDEDEEEEDNKESPSN